MPARLRAGRRPRLALARRRSARRRPGLGAARRSSARRRPRRTLARGVLLTAALVGSLALLASGCGSATTPSPRGGSSPVSRAPASASSPAASASASHAAESGTVSVLYAGSLVAVMQSRLAPAFQAATGYRFAGYAAGSVALANEIKGKLRRADVFISANPSVNASLTGAANGDWVRWYQPFAVSPLVIGYNAKSRFATQLQSKPWYQVMAESGFRVGRTDPKLDPKGALTVQFVRSAATYYHQSGLEAKLLGTSENPAQVFPEQTLVGRLQSGQLDAGFFYRSEAVQAGIPYLTLPAAIDPKAEFTITVVTGALDPAGADAFVRFLLGAQGQAILQKAGLTPSKAKVEGERTAVPSALRPLIQ